MQLLSDLKERARRLKREIHALWLAYRDPRTPWLARLLIACIIAYALSPIDLIPDPIPLLGYVDDLILLPLGIDLALRLIPETVMADCRARARQSAIALPLVVRLLRLPPTQAVPSEYWSWILKTIKRCLCSMRFASDKTCRHRSFIVDLDPSIVSKGVGKAVSPYSSAPGKRKSGLFPFSVTAPRSNRTP